MEDNGGLDILAQLYGEGMIPEENVETENKGEEGDGELHTVDNGSNEVIFTLLELFQDEIKFPLAHFQL